jgi:hypothetical protein
VLLPWRFGACARWDEVGKVPVEREVRRRAVEGRSRDALGLCARPDRVFEPGVKLAFGGGTILRDQLSGGQRKCNDEQEVAEGQGSAPVCSSAILAANVGYVPCVVARAGEQVTICGAPR